MSSVERSFDELSSSQPMAYRFVFLLLEDSLWFINPGSVQLLSSQQRVLLVC